jgi:hypothetical protein
MVPSHHLSHGTFSSSLTSHLLIIPNMIPSHHLSRHTFSSSLTWYLLIIYYIKTVSQAILGSSADIRTLDGAVTMKINPGTQSGSTFSITGKGISKVNSSASKRYSLLDVKRCIGLFKGPISCNVTHSRLSLVISLKGQPLRESVRHNPFCDF